MEEDGNDGHIECKQHHIAQRKVLNFNAPLLTTRRPANLAAISVSSCPSTTTFRRPCNTNDDDHDRIPFSWEKAPGKPKHAGDKPAGAGEESDTPRPKLPPSLWRYRHMIAAKNDTDIGCEADFDDDDNDINDNSDDMNKDGYVSSDAMDVVSLSEAIDIVERSQRAHETDCLTLKIIEDRSRSDNHYPDFIIQRFLPDATALATASVLGAMSLRKNSSNAYDSSSYREAQNSFASSTATATTTTTASFSSPQGCGFEMLFPWRVKHRLCGVKSPVRRGGSGVFGGGASLELQRRHKEKRR